MTNQTSSESLPMGALRGAIITGGSRGIGAAVARRLGEEAAVVVLTYCSRSDAARIVVDDIVGAGGRATAVRLDVGDPDSFPEAFDAAARFLGAAGAGLDVLVANAGIFAAADIVGSGTTLWDRVQAVNARGTLLTLQHGVPMMRDGGRVVALTSVGTRWPSPGEAAYAASKAGVEQVIRVASRELAPRGITANAVAAGPTDTDLFRAAVPADAAVGVAQMTALGRVGTADDVAQVVAILARPEGQWMTGQIIAADGGLV